MKLGFFALAFAAACGGASYQTIKLTNKSPRTIEQYFVYPTGKDRGPSRGKLAPEESTTVKMKSGGVDVYAISEKIIIDEHHRETPEASVTVELKSNVEVVFHDEDQNLPGMGAADVREATFRVTPAPAAGEGDSDSGPEAPIEENDPDAPPPADGM